MKHDKMFDGAWTLSTDQEHYGGEYFFDTLEEAKAYAKEFLDEHHSILLTIPGTYSVYVGKVQTLNNEFIAEQILRDEDDVNERICCNYDEWGFDGADADFVQMDKLEWAELNKLVFDFLEKKKVAQRYLSYCVVDQETVKVELP